MALALALALFGWLLVAVGIIGVCLQISLAIMKGIISVEI
ncbi:MAG: hypothetical protein ACI9D5_000148 [Candidatus Endobugula sp.]|jgi:hypothetical protein